MGGRDCDYPAVHFKTKGKGTVPSASHGTKVDLSTEHRTQTQVNQDPEPGAESHDRQLWIPKRDGAWRSWAASHHPDNCS